MRRSLGRYELTRELGRGGTGVVWAAYDPRRDGEVAVKLLSPRPGLSDITSLERRFLREASLTARLRHPGIPAVHDHGTHEGQLYLVMDLVPGRALDAVLESDGPLPVERAADVTRRTAEVLAHAHAENVVHRDLKPSNLMLTPDGDLKVLDFGVAAALDPQPGEDPPPRNTAESRAARCRPGRCSERTSLHAALRSRHDGMGAVRQICKWCERPLEQRRWRKYCNRRHAVKHRVTSWINQLLTNG